MAGLPVPEVLVEALLERSSLGFETRSLVFVSKDLPQESRGAKACVVGETRAQGSGFPGLAGLQEGLFALFKGFDAMAEVVKVGLRVFKWEHGDFFNEATEVMEGSDRGQRRSIQVAIETARGA